MRLMVWLLHAAGGKSICIRMPCCADNSPESCHAELNAGCKAECEGDNLMTVLYRQPDQCTLLSFMIMQMADMLYALAEADAGSQAAGKADGLTSADTIYAPAESDAGSQAGGEADGLASALSREPLPPEWIDVTTPLRFLVAGGHLKLHEVDILPCSCKAPDLGLCRLLVQPKQSSSRRLPLNLRCW